MSSVHGNVVLITGGANGIGTEVARRLHDRRPKINRMPGPLGKTTSAEKCGEAFIKGIEGRKRQVKCPGWVGLFRWLKPLMSTRLGRSMSERTDSLENH